MAKMEMKLQWEGRPCIYTPEARKCLLHIWDIYTGEAVLEKNDGSFIKAKPQHIRMMDSTSVFADYVWSTDPVRKEEK